MFRRLSILIAAALLFLLLYIPAAHRTSAAGFTASWPYKAALLNSSQTVVVTARTAKSQTGLLTLYEKRDGKWSPALAGIPVTLGRGGTGKIREGDGRTPSGVYPLGPAFGTGDAPGNLKLEYTKTTSKDFWIDDPASEQYNQWVTYDGHPGLRWSSYERLQHPLYKYAVVIGYNTAPVVSGKGSAIFLHIWKGANQPTAGCIAMSESNLLKLMALLDPAKSPSIAIGLAD
ncbi:hypothetical protein C2I18_24755 [Paenibacillus sp. PK3_47]|uniref:L,D-transpeptidase family protein n=1 Tax=Paenibacillus sp. PK3_47 TaxID=2072642 RepID=UPI00201E5064|nr:L,D-transpeptidase family protein [Paenibacillus sp. PK3_47]UQZ36463.1 hypothetical protein C2I18_24755 [Paenibacillus sp. PK3_47]